MVESDQDRVRQVPGWDAREGGTVLITSNTPREFVEMVYESEWDFVNLQELRVRRPGDPRYIGRGRSVS